MRKIIGSVWLTIATIHGLPGAHTMRSEPCMTVSAINTTGTSIQNVKRAK